MLGTYKHMKELLTCPICLKEFKSLMSHIYFKHKITIEKLLEQYPNTKLVLESVKEKVSKTCKKSGCGKWMKGYEYPEWRLQQYKEKFSGEGNPFYGKKHSKKTKKRMSGNHADFTGNKNPLVKWLAENQEHREEYSKRLKEIWNDKRVREKLSKRNSENVKKSMLNGNHNPYSNCEHGWYESKKFKNKFYYQSSYEKTFLKFCETSDKIISLQRLSFVIPYIDNCGKSRNYFADFLVNGNVVIEIKPKSMKDYGNNPLKMESAKKYCSQNGYEYKILMEEELKNLNKVM